MNEARTETLDREESAEIQMTPDQQALCLEALHVLTYSAHGQAAVHLCGRMGLLTDEMRECWKKEALEKYAMKILHDRYREMVPLPERPWRTE